MGVRCKGGREFPDPHVGLRTDPHDDKESDVAHVRIKPLAVLLMAVLCFTAAPVTAQFQDGEPFHLRNGIGWTGVLSEALLGAGAFHAFGMSRWGIYADAKTTHDSRTRERTYLREWNVASIEASFQDFERDPLTDWEEWLFFNFGILRAVTPRMGVVLGAGAARKNVIREYADHTQEAGLSASGIYFVDHEAVSGWEANAFVSALISSGPNLALSAGVDLASRSLTLGIFWVLR